MNPYTPLHPNEQNCSQVFLEEVLLPCKILTELGSSRLETIICELGKSNGFFPFVWMKQADIRRTLINLTVFSRKPFRPNLNKLLSKRATPTFTFSLLCPPGARTYHVLRACHCHRASWSTRAVFLQESLSLRPDPGSAVAQLKSCKSTCPFHPHYSVSKAISFLLPHELGTYHTRLREWL